MIYNIHCCDHKQAIKYGLNHDDLLILFWFVNFRNSKKMDTITIDALTYSYISHQYLADELKILNLSKRAVKNKLLAICNKGVLAKILFQGNKQYYMIPADVEAVLFTKKQKKNRGTNDSNPLPKVSGGDTPKREGRGTENAEAIYIMYDSNTINHNTNINRITESHDKAPSPNIKNQCSQPQEIDRDNIEDFQKDETATALDTSKPQRKKFIPPTIEEVQDYCNLKGYTFEPQAFIDNYSAKGWFIGKTKMINWHSACNTWQRNDNKYFSKENKKPLTLAEQRVTQAMIDRGEVKWGI